MTNKNLIDVEAMTTEQIEKVVKRANSTEYAMFLNDKVKELKERFFINEQ